MQSGKDVSVICADDTFSSCNVANTGISTSVNITAFPQHTQVMGGLTFWVLRH